jgi:hypothetical protein
VKVASASASWTCYTPDVQAGADLGAYVVDQVLLLFGPVVSVYAGLDDAGGGPGRLLRPGTAMP